MADEFDDLFKITQEVKEKLEESKKSFEKFMSIYAEYAKASNYSKEKQYCDVFANIVIKTEKYAISYRDIYFYHREKTKKSIFGCRVQLTDTLFMKCCCRSDFSYLHDQTVEDGAEYYYADIVEAAKAMKGMIVELNDKRLATIETIKAFGEL